MDAWKQGSGARTYFLYDGELLLGEYDSAGTVTAVNTWGAYGLVSRRSGGSSVHSTWDAQGSLAQRLDGTGAVLTSHLYDTFGAESASGSTTDPYRYGGQWGYYTDGETGLCLLTHRYYDPGTGRFLNRDPIGYAGGVNVYGYVANSPLSRIDPSGTVAWREVPTTADEGWPRLYHHAYIDFGPGVDTDCAGKSFGFWSQGVTTPDDARTRGDRFRIVSRDNDPKFEMALCKGIKESRRVGHYYESNFPWGANWRPHYACGSWVKDVWG